MRKSCIPPQSLKLLLFVRPEVVLPRTAFKEPGATSSLFCGKQVLDPNHESIRLKTGKCENGAQETKLTIGLTRVGAMVAEMLFLLHKGGILVILRFGTRNVK